jgi:hypothetical protein
MLSGGHQHNKKVVFVNKLKISCLPKEYLLFLVYEEYESWMRRKSQSCMTESFLIRRKFLLTGNVSSYMMNLHPNSYPVLHMKCEKKYPTLYFYNI